MKWIFIGFVVLIGLFDYALIVACSRMEDRETYLYEQWREENKKNEEVR